MRKVLLKENIYLKVIFIIPEQIIRILKGYSPKSVMRVLPNISKKSIIETLTCFSGKQSLIWYL